MKTKEAKQTLRLRTGDTPSVERGLELKGYYRHRRYSEALSGKFGGLDAYVTFWERKGSPYTLALIVWGDSHMLFKLTDISPFFDGDWSEAESFDR